MGESGAYPDEVTFPNEERPKEPKMDNIEAALERLAEALRQFGHFLDLDNPYLGQEQHVIMRGIRAKREASEALSTIRQALREQAAQLELAKDIAGEYRRRMMQAEDRIEKLEALANYAANMPDSENMPEWAKELRHHARQALSTPSEEPAT